MWCHSHLEFMLLHTCLFKPRSNFSEGDVNTYWVWWIELMLSFGNMCWSAVQHKGQFCRQADHMLDSLTSHVFGTPLLDFSGDIYMQLFLLCIHYLQFRGFIYILRIWVIYSHCIYYNGNLTRKFMNTFIWILRMFTWTWDPNTTFIFQRISSSRAILFEWEYIRQLRWSARPS